MHYTVRELIKELGRHYDGEGTTVVKVRVGVRPDGGRRVVNVTTEGEETARQELAEAQQELDTLNAKLRKLIQEYATPTPTKG